MYDTLAPLHVPVTDACLGRLLNGFGEPLDGGPRLRNREYRNIHGQPVALSEAVGVSEPVAAYNTAMPMSSAAAPAPAIRNSL